MVYDVKSVNELINKSYNVELIKEIIKIIEEELKEKGTLFKTNNDMALIGYKYIDYKNSNYDGKWPIVSVAPQKNNISVYIFAFNNGKYIAEIYADVFGKSNVGKSCIRIKKLNKKREKSLREMLHVALKED